jgi:hypothetical protein
MATTRSVASSVAKSSGGPRVETRDLVAGHNTPT